jgi:DNA invertase Pin-like site-specific DNA recombinase
MKDAIGYLRVSTKEQGRSGVGLAAQRRDIELFAAREGLKINSWHQDVQTGAGTDALQLRPGLATALKEAKAAKCSLVVSRLDRLSRNVHFVSWLMEHRVHFMVASLGKDCDDFTLHIYASLAEQERKFISERTKAAFAVLRQKGVKLGMARLSKARRREVHAKGQATLVRVAIERAEAYRIHMEWALRQPGLYGRKITLSHAAYLLNERNIEGPYGGRWAGHQLQKMAHRIGIRHMTPWVRSEQVREKVLKIWKIHPQYSDRQVKALLDRSQAIGIGRIDRILTECRGKLAKRSAVHRLVKWRLDQSTYARTRIGAIWSRHPEYTAAQVRSALDLEFLPRKHWVQQVIQQCWQASGRHTTRERNVGRRNYYSGRAKK